jgi:spore germination protein YaaH
MYRPSLGPNSPSDMYDANTSNAYDANTSNAYDANTTKNNNDSMMPVTTTTTTTMIIIPKEPERGMTAWLDYMNRNKRENTLMNALKNMLFKDRA